MREPSSGQAKRKKGPRHAPASLACKRPALDVSPSRDGGSSVRPPAAAAEAGNAYAAPDRRPAAAMPGRFPPMAPKQAHRPHASLRQLSRASAPSASHNFSTDDDSFVVHLSSEDENERAAHSPLLCDADIPASGRPSVTARLPPRPPGAVQMPPKACAERPPIGLGASREPSFRSHQQRQSKPSGARSRLNTASHVASPAAEEPTHRDAVSISSPS